LKTACTALPDGRLLVNPDWIATEPLDGFALLPVPASEPWGSNVLCVGETVCAPVAHGATVEMIRRFGFDVRTVDLSEFAKAEAGVTCLSLLIN
jgi:dimethylargininase